MHNLVLALRALTCK